MVLRLSKHHGLGNDFLVALVERLPPDASSRAGTWCDRRTGIGADGLIFGIPTADGIAMWLFNSDGSPAALSGNGLACLAQAVARDRGVATLKLDVSTPVGVSPCTVSATPDSQRVAVAVDMGIVCPSPAPDVDDLMAAVGSSVELVSRWETGDIGNPHVICQVEDPYAIDLLVAGPAVASHFGDGANVHFVTVSGTNELAMRVWERGAGVTEACGTGAVVAADVFHRWSLVGSEVVVRMPGGEALVDLSGPFILTVLASHVADLEISYV